MDDDGVVMKEDLRSTIRGLGRSEAKFSPAPSGAAAGASRRSCASWGQSAVPGSSVSLVCRMHGISSGQLYTWRKQFRTGEMTCFAPVTMLADAPAEQLAAPASAADPAAAVIATESPAS